MSSQTQIFPGKRALSVVAEIPFAATPPPAPAAQDATLTFN